MTCEYCNGTGETLITVVHSQSKIKTMASAPCLCLASMLVSQENKLLRAYGENYIHPDKLDPRLVFIPNDLANSPNLIIRSESSLFFPQVKTFLMKHRFANPKPRILFARSIDILHHYYVPQDDGLTQHLSATSVFDLMIITFGTLEKNQALATCMAQIINTRIEEQRPTWINLPSKSSVLRNCEQEYSEVLQKLILDNFKGVVIDSGETCSRSMSASINEAANFDVGGSLYDNYIGQSDSTSDSTGVINKVPENKPHKVLSINEDLANFNVGR